MHHRHQLLSPGLLPPRAGPSCCRALRGRDVLFFQLDPVVPRGTFWLAFAKASPAKGPLQAAELLPRLAEAVPPEDSPPTALGMEEPACMCRVPGLALLPGTSTHGLPFKHRLLTAPLPHCPGCPVEARSSRPLFLPHPVGTHVSSAAATTSSSASVQGGGTPTIHPLPGLPSAHRPVFLPPVHYFISSPIYPITPSILPSNHQSLITIGPSSYPSNPPSITLSHSPLFAPKPIFLPVHCSTRAPTHLPSYRFPHPSMHSAPSSCPSIHFPTYFLPLCQPTHQPASWSTHCAHSIPRGRSRVSSIVPATRTAVAAAH